MKGKQKEWLKRMLSVVLSFSIVAGEMQIPVQAEESDIYLPEIEISEEVRSSGEFYIASSNAQIQENAASAYLFQIARGGETLDASSVRLDIMDITAKYGKDYKIKIHSDSGNEQEVQSADESRSLLEEIVENKDAIEEENYSNGVVSGEDMTDKEAVDLYNSDVETLAGYLNDTMGEDVTVEPIDSKEQSADQEEKEAQTDTSSLSLKKAKEIATGIESDKQPMDGGDTLSDYMQELLTGLSEELDSAYLEIDFAAGETSKYIEIIPQDNTVGDGDRNFQANLFASSENAKISDASGITVTILDDEEHENAIVSFQKEEYTPENGFATIKLERSGAINQMAVVKISTKAVTAVEGRDYSQVETSVAFPYGITERNINIPVRSEYLKKNAEFQIQLGETLNCELGSIGETKVIISPDSESFEMKSEESQGGKEKKSRISLLGESTVDSLRYGSNHSLDAYSSSVSHSGYARKDGTEYHLNAYDAWKNASANAYFSFGEHYDYSGIEVKWSKCAGKPSYSETTLKYYDYDSSTWKNMYYGDTERWDNNTDRYFTSSPKFREIYFNLYNTGGWAGKTPTLKIHYIKPILRPFEVSLVGAEPLEFLDETGHYVKNTSVSELQSATNVWITDTNKGGKSQVVNTVRFSGEDITLISSSAYSYIKGIKIVGADGSTKIIKNNLPVGTESVNVHLDNDFIRNNLDYITFENNGSKGKKGKFSIQPIMGYYDTTVTVHEDYRGKVEFGVSEEIQDGTWEVRIKNMETGEYLRSVKSKFSNAVEMGNSDNAYSIWYIQAKSDGTCMIDGKKSDYLNIKNNGITFCTWIQPYDFKLQENEDGSYAILTKASHYKRGLSLSENNREIRLSEYTSQTRQKWKLEFAGITNGRYRIKNVNSGKYLCNAGANTKGNVTQGTYTNDARTVWNIVYENDSYRIENANGYCLDVSGSSSSNGANIQTWEKNGGNAQKFSITQQEDGSFAILTAASAYSKGLDVSGKSKDNGANVHQWAYAGQNNQKWIFEPAGGYLRTIHKGDMLKLIQTVNADYKALYTASRIRLVTKENSNKATVDNEREYDKDKDGNLKSECTFRNNYISLDVYPDFDKKNNKIIVRVLTKDLSKFDTSQGIFTKSSDVSGEYTEYTVVDSSSFSAGNYYEMTAVTKDPKTNVAVWNPIHTQDKYSQETFYFYGSNEIEKNIVYLEAQKADSTMYSLSATAHYADVALTGISEKKAWLAADGVYVLIGSKNYGISSEGKLETIPIYGSSESKGDYKVIYKTVASGVTEYKTAKLSKNKTKTFQAQDTKLTVYDVNIGDIVARSYDENSPYPRGVTVTDADLTRYTQIPITNEKSYYLSASINNNHAVYYDSEENKEKKENVIGVDFVIYDSLTNKQKYVISGAKPINDDETQWSVAQTFKTGEDDKFAPSDRIYVVLKTDKLVGNGKSFDLEGNEIKNPALQQTTYAPVYTGLTLASVSSQDPVTQDIDFDTNMDFVQLPLIGSMDATFNIKSISLSLTELPNGRQRLSFGYIPKTEEEKTSPADDGNDYGVVDLKAKALGVKEFGKSVGSLNSIGMKSWGLYPIFGLYIDYGIDNYNKYTTHTSKKLVCCGGGLYIGVTGNFRFVQYFVVGWFPLYMGTEGEMTAFANAGLTVENEETATSEHLLHTSNSFSEGFYPDVTIQANAQVKAYVGAGLCGTLGARGGIQFDGSYIYKPGIKVTYPTYHENGAYLNVSIKVWIDAVLFAVPIPVVTLTEQRYGYYEDVENGKKNGKSLLGTAEDTDTQVFMKERNSQNAKWMPKGKMSLLSTFQKKGSTTLMENGYDRADPQLLDIGNGRTLLVFLADDKTRTDENRTALMYSIFADGTWSTPKVIQNDATADFEPNLCDAGGKVLISWTSREPGQTYTNESDYLKSLDVYTTVMDKETLAISEIERLTKDEFYDSTPVGMYDEETGDMAVYYLKSEVKGDFEEDISPMKNESVIVYMLYDASKNQWARTYYYDNEVENQEAADLLVEKYGGQRFLASPLAGFGEGDATVNDPIIIDFDAVSYNGLGVYTYTVDKDNNMDTTEDRELFVQVYDFASHATYHPIRITNDNVSDSRPQLVRNNDNTYLFWLQNNTDICYIDLSDVIQHGINEKGQIKDDYELNKSIVFFCNSEDENVTPTFGSYTALVDKDGNLFVTWLQPVTNEDGSSSQEVYASALIKNESGTSWSDGVRLTDSHAFNDEVAIVTDKDGNLLIVNNQYQMDLTNDKYEVTDVKLVATNFETVGSMEVSNVEFSDETPMVESDVDVKFSIKNTGLKPANGYSIEVFEKVNGKAGNKIYEADVKNLITPSSTDFVNFTWKMPDSYEDIKDLSLYVTVKEADMDEVSTFTSESLKFKPEYEIVDYEVTEQSDGFYVSYTIANNGNMAAQYDEKGDKLVVGWNDIYYTGKKEETFLSATIGDLAIGEEKTYVMPLSISDSAFAYGYTTAYMQVQDNEGEALTEEKTFDIDLEQPYNIVVNGEKDLKTITVEEGKSIKLSAEYTPKEYYTDGDMVYTTTDDTIARVQDNKLIGVSQGTTKLEVSVAPYGGYKEIEVVVKKATTDPEPTVSPAEVQKNSIKLDKKAVVEWKDSKVKLTWGEVTNATGYDIFAEQYGKKLTSKSLVKTVKGKTTSATLTKISGKKLSDASTYEFKIKAFKTINGKKVYIGASQLYYLTGKKNKTYTNAKKVVVTKKTVSLKKGKTSQIKATVEKENKKKKLLDKWQKSTVRYYSTNSDIATVTSKGNIKAKKKGTCYIYVTGLNGVGTRVKVTVK